MTDAATLKMLLIEFNSERRLSCILQPTKTGMRVEFHLPAGANEIIWPPFDHLHREDRLWESTCFELFLKEPDSNQYLEINLSPSGGWNVYAFTGYREGMQASNRLAVDSIIQESRSSLVAELNWQGSPITDVMLNAACILVDPAGEPAFFSIEHGPKPDFHDAAHYVRTHFDSL